MEINYNKVKVIGFDKSEAKVNKINSGENYIKDIRDAVFKFSVKQDLSVLEIQKVEQSLEDVFKSLTV